MSMKSDSFVGARRVLAAVLVASGLCVSLTSAKAGAPNGPKVGDQPPEINCSGWLNSQALSLKDLRGRVVLLEFWSPG